MLTHNVADALEKKWHPEKPSIFYVIDRHNGGLVAKYKVRPLPDMTIVPGTYKYPVQTDAFHAFHIHICTRGVFCIYRQDA